MVTIRQIVNQILSKKLIPQLINIKSQKKSFVTTSNTTSITQMY